MRLTRVSSGPSRRKRWKMPNRKYSSASYAKKLRRSRRLRDARTVSFPWVVVSFLTTRACCALTACLSMHPRSSRKRWLMNFSGLVCRGTPSPFVCECKCSCGWTMVGWCQHDYAAVCQSALCVSMRKVVRDARVLILWWRFCSRAVTRLS